MSEEKNPMYPQEPQKIAPQEHQEKAFHEQQRRGQYIANGDNTKPPSRGHYIAGEDNIELFEAAESFDS